MCPQLVLLLPFPTDVVPTNTEPLSPLHSTPLYQNVGGDWWCYEDDGGSTYYLNAVTQETQWEAPTVEQVGTVDSSYAAGALAGEAEMPRGWEALVDEAGETYYYHEASGSSQWEFPDGGASSPRAVESIIYGSATADDFERAKLVLAWQVRTISYDGTVAIAQLDELINRHEGDVDTMFSYIFDECNGEAAELTQTALTSFLQTRAAGLALSTELFLQISLHSRLDANANGTVDRDEFVQGMKAIIVLPEGSPFREWFLQELDGDFTAATEDELELRGGGAEADTWDVTYWKALASQLHDLWRSSRARLTDGSYEPRPKLVDGEWFDIANLTYAELPEHFQRSNQESAQCACKEVMNAIAGGRELDEVFVEAASVVQHDNWMRVNGEWADASLMVEYDMLPEDEKEKDRVIVRKAVESWHLLKGRHQEIVEWQERVGTSDVPAAVSPRTLKKREGAGGFDVHEAESVHKMGGSSAGGSAPAPVTAKAMDAAKLKRAQQISFKKQWNTKISGWAYKKQQRRCVRVHPHSLLLPSLLPPYPLLFTLLTTPPSPLSLSLPLTCTHHTHTHTHTLSFSLSLSLSLAATSSRSDGSCSKMGSCITTGRRRSGTKASHLRPRSRLPRSRRWPTHRQRAKQVPLRGKRVVPSTSTLWSAA